MNSGIRNEKSIETKVFVGLGLLVVLVVFVAFITFRSFNNLTRSADRLAAPNQNIEMLHDIIFSIYQAESNIRKYTLTQDEDFLNLYFIELEKIDSRVDSLYRLSVSDPYFSTKLDSINLLLNAKVSLLEQFIELKSTDDNSVFYDMAIRQVARITTTEKTEPQEELFVAEEDDEEIEEQTTTPEPKITEEVILNDEEEKRGLLRRFIDFFSRQKQDDTKDEAETEEAGEITEFADIPYFPIELPDVDYEPDIDMESLRSDIQKVLADVQRMAVQYQREMMQRENEILFEDKQIMDRIWNIITLLEDYERNKVSIEASDSHDIVRSSSRTIFIIILVCFFILIVFSWMISYDIARSRFYKQQLMSEKDRAESMVKIKQRFMAHVSHEVRTPLSAIIGFTNQMKKTRLNDDQELFNEAIEKSSNHLLGIVNDILDFSKIEAGKLVLENIALNIRDLTYDIYYALNLLAKEKNLDFNVDFSGLKNTMVYGDPLRIKQILLNLAGNAVKFTDEGYVKITLSDSVSSEEPDFINLHFNIEDSGPGIAPEQQKIIFEEFAQAETFTTRKHGGTGLGLSISARLIELMKGTINLKSEPGKGSSFSVLLPLRKVDDVDINDEELSQDKNTEYSPGKPVFDIRRYSNPPMEKVNVLVVEDKRTNQMVVSMMLKDMGCNVELASNGEEALEKVEPGKFDLIFLDIQMPVMDGYTTFNALRKKYNDQDMPYVVGLSGKVLKEDVEFAITNGMDDYVPKPVTVKSLQECLKKWADKLSSKGGK
ncbi:MAG: response regulator [Bacteroidetes bacterium]|nr:MAG: response regulator [Bacteroidota bacterium]